jgi:hypothetical protein
MSKKKHKSSKKSNLSTIIFVCEVKTIPPCIRSPLINFEQRVSQIATHHIVEITQKVISNVKSFTLRRKIIRFLLHLLNSLIFLQRVIAPSFNIPSFQILKPYPFKEELNFLHLFQL